MKRILITLFCVGFVNLNLASNKNAKKEGSKNAKKEGSENAKKEGSENAKNAVPLIIITVKNKNIAFVNLDKAERSSRSLAAVKIYLENVQKKLQGIMAQLQSLARTKENEAKFSKLQSEGSAIYEKLQSYSARITEVRKNIISIFVNYLCEVRGYEKVILIPGAAIFYSEKYLRENCDDLTKDYLEFFDKEMQKSGVLNDK